MDIDALVDAIYARVAAQLEAAAQREEVPVPEAPRPGLLLLTRDHGERCHAALESAALKERFHTGCAQMQDGECSLEQYEGVVLYQFTNEALVKLATGIFDTPYTRLAGRALLEGKKLYVPVEEIELFRYAGTAPRAYYRMLERHLELLKQSGVVICADADLEEAILCDAQPRSEPVIQASPPPAPPAPDAGVRILDKRVVTERDLRAAKDGGAAVVRLGKRTLLTALAQDYAREVGLKLQREQESQT